MLGPGVNQAGQGSGSAHRPETRSKKQKHSRLRADSDLPAGVLRTGLTRGFPWGEPFGPRAGLKIHKMHLLLRPGRVFTPTRGLLVTSGIVMTIQYRGHTLWSGGTAAQLPRQWPANRRMQEEYHPSLSLEGLPGAEDDSFGACQGAG